jgi:hypothetical protein
MNKLKTVFVTAAGVFAIIPGLTVLVSNIGVPPNTSKYIFSGTLESLGIFTLLILWLNKDHFNKYSKRAITRIGVLSILAFLLALATYIILFGYQVLNLPYQDSLFFPLWSSGKLQSGLETYGSKYELVSQWGRDEVFRQIQKSSSFALLATTIIFLFIYQLIFVSLTFCFGVLGIVSSREDEGRDLQHG